MGWVLISTRLPLYLRERDATSIVQKADWVPRPVWTDAENLAPTGFVPWAVQSTHGTMRQDIYGC